MVSLSSPLGYVVLRLVPVFIVLGRTETNAAIGFVTRSAAIPRQLQA